MSTEDLTPDLLAYHAFPLLASALSLRKDAILQNLRNSVPLILQEIIEAFSSDKPFTTRALMEGSKMHGEPRFQANYNMRELVVEYRLLRRVIIGQVSEVLDERLDLRSNIALNMAVDTDLQSSIVMFTEHLQHQIRTSTEVQSKYLSFLSHDLRNHLHHAMLHLQLLAMRLAKIPEYANNIAELESVKRAILQTTAGMDRLLQSEQLRKEEPVHHTAELVDLSLLLSEVAKRLAHEAESKGLELEVDVSEGAQAISDEGLLTLILQNLMGNAVKYSSRGRVKMMARNNSNNEDISWVVSISDQGPGIASENLSHLFDAFQRGDTYGKPGVELGLSIASEATRLLGASWKSSPR